MGGTTSNALRLPGEGLRLLEVLRKAGKRPDVERDDEGTIAVLVSRVT